MDANFIRRINRLRLPLRVRFKARWKRWPLRLGNAARNANWPLRPSGIS